MKTKTLTARNMTAVKGSLEQFFLNKEKKITVEEFLKFPYGEERENVYKKTANLIRNETTTISASKVGVLNQEVKSIYLSTEASTNNKKPYRSLYWFNEGDKFIFSDKKIFVKQVKNQENKDEDVVIVFTN